jgi:glycosyltransferase involved in cell wall biosynthesis
MGNAREIISRLDPQRFHVSVFVRGTPDPRLAARANTRLIPLPSNRQTARILPEFLWGPHDLLFYVKASPSSKWYLRLRKQWQDDRVTVGTVECQCDFRSEPEVPREAIRLWEQTVLRCDYLYSNCLHVQKSLEREYGLKSEVIETGADTQFFTPEWERPRNARPRVLFVGSLCHRKQPQFLLAAAQHFPSADFRIAGDGPMASELVAGIAERGLRNVTLAGLLGPERLREEYRRADIFLFPSAFEGSPKVIVEAAACGLPVIARNNYEPETVVHGETGYLAGSDEELMSSLGLLLGDAELGRKLGRAGRVHSRRFDWDLITRQWEKTFERVVGKQELRRAS